VVPQVVVVCQEEWGECQEVCQEASQGACQVDHQEELQAVELMQVLMILIEQVRNNKSIVRDIINVF
jgi:hypothetical protein